VFPGIQEDFIIINYSFIINKEKKSI
jgi:hypothetical protein